MRLTVRGGHLFRGPSFRRALFSSESFDRFFVLIFRPHLAPTASELSGATAMRYWLMKSEPDDVSIDDLAAAPKQTVPWTGVRNFQARNFMKDEMRIGDGVLFYPSSCPQPAVAGTANGRSE